MLFSSSAKSINIVTAIVISGGSANLESRDSLVPLLCVPGFPQVCSEQRKKYRLKNQEYYKDRLKSQSNAKAIIRTIRKKVCDMEYMFLCNNCDMDYNFLPIICVDLLRQVRENNETLFR